MPAAERRAAILDAAITVFAQRGYHGSSLDDIAGEAHVSKALIYEHFASKRELHASLLAEYVGDLFARLQANAFSGTTGAERLRGGLDAFFAFVEANRPAFRALLRDATDPEVAEALQGVQQQALSVIVAIMHADPDKPAPLPGETPEQFELGAAMLAAQLSGAMQSLAAWWDDHPELPRTVVVDRAMEFAFLGLDRLRAGERVGVRSTGS
jgi:AcrR family transcriptional regulator